MRPTAMSDRPAAVLLVGLLLLGVIFLGCGRRAAPPRTPPDLPQTMPSEEEAQQAREDARQAIPVLPEGERGLGSEDLLPSGESEGTAEEPSPVPERYGYRVQLFATGDRKLAEKRAEEYRQVFDEPVYVEFEGLLYKVRVGDCLSRDDADALRRKALGAGLEGAFVVDTLVRAR